MSGLLGGGCTRATARTSPPVLCRGRPYRAERASHPAAISAEVTLGLEPGRHNVVPLFSARQSAAQKRHQKHSPTLTTGSPTLIMCLPAGSVLSAQGPTQCGWGALAFFGGGPEREAADEYLRRRLQSVLWRSRPLPTWRLLATPLQHGEARILYLRVRCESVLPSRRPHLHH